MSVPVPDGMLSRRVASLERQLAQLEQLVRASAGNRSVTPLNARLWRATLNATFSGGSAAADLLTISGTDTGLDITLYDPLAVFVGLANGAEVYALEQIDVNGTRRFVPIQTVCPTP